MCKMCGCSAGNEHIEFKIRGITLFNKKRVEKMLLGLPGVYHVHLHLFDGKASLEYNPKKTSALQIKELLENSGFHASYDEEG